MNRFCCYQSVCTSMNFQVIHTKLIPHFWQCITIIRDNNFCLIFVLHYISATNSWTFVTHCFPHNRELLTLMIIKATPSPFLSFLFDIQQCTYQPYHQQQYREVLEVFCFLWGVCCKYTLTMHHLTYSVPASACLLTLSFWWVIWESLIFNQCW